MGTTSVVNGRLALFRNYDEYDNRYSVPRTLLIDSHQLESGEKLSDDFRRAAADLIERFRRERQERTGNREEADKISEQELLREIPSFLVCIGPTSSGVRSSRESSVKLATRSSLGGSSR